MDNGEITRDKGPWQETVESSLLQFAWSKSTFKALASFQNSFPTLMVYDFGKIFNSGAIASQTLN